MPDFGDAFLGPLPAPGNQRIRGEIDVRSGRIFMRQPAQIPGLKRTLQRDDSLDDCGRRSAAKDDRNRLAGAKDRPRNSRGDLRGQSASLCGMVRLHDGLDQESLRVTVIAANGQNFADNSATRLALDVDHEIDGLSDLGFGIGRMCSGRGCASPDSRSDGVPFRRSLRGWLPAIRRGRY